MANSCCEIKWLSYILQDLQVPIQSPIVLQCDSAAAISIAINPVLHEKMKHVALDIHFARELISEGFVTTPHIPSEL